jgi:hypothetical protein
VADSPQARQPQARQSEAIIRAQIARLNLTGFLAVYTNSGTRSRPWRGCSHSSSVENWQAFPIAGKTLFQAIAFALIDSLPPPIAPHASTPP